MNIAVKPDFLEHVIGFESIVAKQELENFGLLIWLIQHYQINFFRLVTELRERPKKGHVVITEGPSPWIRISHPDGKFLSEQAKKHYEEISEHFSALETDYFELEEILNELNQLVTKRFMPMYRKHVNSFPFYQPKKNLLKELRETLEKVGLGPKAFKKLRDMLDRLDYSTDLEYEISQGLPPAQQGS